MTASSRTVVQYPDSCLLQFAKAPLVGQVKTRLESSLSKARCLDLHEALVRYQFGVQLESEITNLELWCGSEHEFFHWLTKGTNVRVVVQEGLSLGERMANAFADRLRQFSRVVIIGSDCPAIQADYIDQALSALNDDVPAVFGPAIDGGYVLIGLNRFNPALFDGISWGTDKVMNETRNRLEVLGWQWKELAPLADIDRPEDLVELSNYPELSKFIPRFL